MSDVEKQYATGLGAIDESLVVEGGKTYQLISVSLKVDVAPTTSEDFVVTLNSAGGDVYDVPLYTLDLSITGVTSLVWLPDQPLYLVGGDSLDVAWTNTDARQWGLEYTVMRVHP
jgi:hypothetical protein